MLTAILAAGMGWNLVMRIAQDKVFGYSSSYWTNDALLNENSPANATGNAKRSRLLATSSCAMGTLLFPGNQKQVVQQRPHCIPRALGKWDLDKVAR